MLLGRPMLLISRSIRSRVKRGQRRLNRSRVKQVRKMAGSSVTIRIAEFDGSDDGRERPGPRRFAGTCEESEESI